MDDFRLKVLLPVILFAAVLVPALHDSVFASDDPGPESIPTHWMRKLAKDMEQPTALSSEAQNLCTTRILDSLNEQFGLHLDVNDVAPILAPGWKNPEMGFVRGGGYNIRIYATGLSTAALKKIQAGRFIGQRKRVFEDLNPSLHVPNLISGVKTMTKGQDQSGGKIDFIAHIDSAWGYLPIGFFAHIWEDVVHSGTRNPCPEN